MTRTALITGVTGQDGSYLAERLLGLGYEVHGLIRPESIAPARARLVAWSDTLDSVRLHESSLVDTDRLRKVLDEARPDEVYHLASVSFAGPSPVDPFTLFRVNVDGTHHVLEAVRRSGLSCAVLLAGSSEMFGNASASPQDEATPPAPRSPYGVSKVTTFYLGRLYREAHGMPVSTAILYNHESPRRGHSFVTRKVTSSAARIARGQSRELLLGNLDACRDWGDARDYVIAMHRMATGPAGDYVIATGTARTVRDFCELAFRRAGLDYREFVRTSPEFYRPAEAVPLVGDATKARRELGWTPTIPFETTVASMVDHDLGSADGNS